MPSAHQNNDTANLINVTYAVQTLDQAQSANPGNFQITYPRKFTFLG